MNCIHCNTCIPGNIVYKQTIRDKVYYREKYICNKCKSDYNKSYHETVRKQRRRDQGVKPRGRSRLLETNPLSLQCCVCKLELPVGSFHLMVLYKKPTYSATCRSCNFQLLSKWRRENPFKNLINAHKRRTRNRDAEGSFTSVEWIDLCKKFNNRCAFCNIECNLTMDHIIPLSKGGSNYISNIQPLCRKCNCSKGSKILSSKN